MLCGGESEALTPSAMVLSVVTGLTYYAAVSFLTYYILTRRRGADTAFITLLQSWFMFQLSYGLHVHVLVR